MGDSCVGERAGGYFGEYFGHAVGRKFGFVDSELNVVIEH